MDTFETKGTTLKLRETLRSEGFLIENLGGGYYNVSCNHVDADKLEELLMSMEVEYRLV